MSENAVVVLGFVRPDGTLELDGKVPMPAGRVSVTLELVPISQEKDPFFVMLRRIWAEREKAGLKPRSKEEIDAQIRAIRDEFDEQVEELGRLQDECRRQREEAKGGEAETP